MVGSDGRASSVRNWADFVVNRDTQHNIVGGVLLDECPAPDDAAAIWPNPSAGWVALLFPQGGGRVRAYVGYERTVERRLSGEADLPEFIQSSVRCGVPAEYLSRAKPVGPLATFEGAPTWVQHPYKNGVALIGDAAYASDPTYGQGLSLTMRDVRVLRDKLSGEEDWDTAGHEYADVHDQYQGAMHTYETWRTKLTMTTGPEADALRAKALPLWAQDPTRHPDVTWSGPDVSLDEQARRRFFGEE